eukprot:7910476-Pyramimonas_sp.AAC.1
MTLGPEGRPSLINLPLGRSEGVGPLPRPSAGALLHKVMYIALALTQGESAGRRTYASESQSSGSTAEASTVDPHGRHAKDAR